MEPSGPFIIALAHLEEGESHREMVATPAELDIDVGRVPLASSVVARGRFFRRGAKVEIQGTAHATLELPCDRCLRPVTVAIHAPLRIFAERRDGRDRRREEEVREDDLGIIYHDGRSIDLTDEIRQELLVQVPWHVRCKPDCRGICAGCGRDLNDEVCGCADREVGRS